MSQYRITKNDPLNWAIEEQKIISDKMVNRRVSPRAGEVTWNAIGYYPSLKALLPRLLDLNIAAEFNATGQLLLDTINQAEVNVLASLTALKSEG